ncbi:MAG: type II CAAX prenyl endopeptidase Rce1 family protein [Legionella sp.]
MGIILVSLLFVMAYDVVWIGNILGIIELLIMAIVYGLFREKTDSIWPSVLCHSFTTLNLIENLNPDWHDLYTDICR